MTNTNEELWRKHKAYLQQFTSYIRKRANNESNVELALSSLLLASLYQAMTLVLAPKCPEDFQAQVDAVMSTLDRVLDFLYDASKETRDQLGKEVVAKFDSFLEFIGRCAGFEAKITDNPPDQVLSLVYGGERKTKYLLLGRPLPQAPVLPPSPSVLEQTKMLAKALADYHSQLVEYILQKTGKGKDILLALKGFEIAYLYNDMALVLLYPCPWLFTGDYLETTVDELKNIVKLLNGDYSTDKEVEYGYLAFAELDYIIWKQAFLHDIAPCFGVDLEVELIPKGNGMELAIVKYEPITS
jgi:hypothetical protein